MSARLFAALDRRLRLPGSKRFWLGATAVLGVLAAMRLLVQVYRPGIRLQNDALQFTSWMARWSEPALNRPDLVLDYWDSVTPWVYSLVFRAAFLVGLDPVTTAKLLPVPLLVLLPLAAWRLARGLGAEPVVAFIVSILAVQWAGDLPASGTPRAFWPVLLLFVFDGLVRRSVVQTALAQGLLAGCYPQVALASAGMIGLSPLLGAGGHWIDLSRRRVRLVAAAAAATVLGLLPTLIGTGGFGPVATLADARAIPTFQFGGRGAVFEADGSVDVFCGERLGLFGGRCDGPGDPRLWLFAAMLMAAPAILLVRTIRRRGSAGGGLPARAATPHVAFLVLSGIAWAVLAQLFLFRLHLPSRYSEGPILLAGLATLLLVSEAIRARPLPDDLARRPWGRWLLGGTAVLMAAAALGAASEVTASARAPERPAVVEAAAATPPGARLAGFVEELDYAPVFARRQVLFTREHAIAYQLGYFRDIEVRMNHLRDLVQTPDRAMLAELLSQNRFDALFVESETLERGTIPEIYHGFFAANDPPPAPTALSAIAGGCRTSLVEGVSVLDADCLRRAVSG